MEKHARWDIIFFVGVFSSLNTREVRKKEPKLVQYLKSNSVDSETKRDENKSNSYWASTD